VTIVSKADQEINEKNDDDYDTTQKPVAVKKILIAVDKSGYKDKVISFGITMAKALGADLIAIHVIDKYSLGIAGELLGYYRGGKSGTYRAYEDLLKEQAEKLLAEAEILGKKEGIKVDTEVIHASSVTEEIIDYAKRKNIDLIVIGTKGMTGPAKFLMGGVASNVVAHAQCPVLAVR